MKLVSRTSPSTIIAFAALLFLHSSQQGTTVPIIACIRPISLPHNKKLLLSYNKSPNQF